MRLKIISVIAIMVVFAACDNQNSSTVGSYEREESHTVENKKQHEVSTHHGTTDTAKASIATENNHMDVETKSTSDSSHEVNGKH